MSYGGFIHKDTYIATNNNNKQNILLTQICSHTAASLAEALEASLPSIASPVAACGGLCLQMFKFVYVTGYTYLYGHQN